MPASDRSEVPGRRGLPGREDPPDRPDLADLPLETIPCADLDAQERTLKQHRDELLLELSPLRAKSIVLPLELSVLVEKGGEGLAAAIARRGRVASSIAVMVAHAPSDPRSFWAGVQRFARASKHRALAIESYGDPPTPIPAAPGESERARMHGYVVDLPDHDPYKALKKNHRRNVQRARANGAEVVCRAGDDAIRSHIRLVESSLERRRERGEQTDPAPTPETLRRFLERGASLFQVTIGERVHSSDLVIRVGDAAYYTSGGTDPDGRKLGTAHLLMYGIIDSLKDDGTRVLNLGYPNDEGLSRFKEGFGARRVDVERAVFRLESSLVLALRRMLHRLRVR